MLILRGNRRPFPYAAARNTYGGPFMGRTLGIALLLLLILPGLSAAEHPFHGHACISLEGSDLRAARLLAHSAAVLHAVQATGALHEVPVQGSEGLAGEILQMLRSAHLEEVRVLEHTETDEAVCETVEIRVDPEALRRAVRRKIGSRTGRAGDPGLGRNGCLRILGIEEEEDRYGRRVSVTVQTKRATGPLHTPERRRGRPCFKVCIDFFGPGGVPLDGDARYIDETAEGLLGGEIRTLAFHAPEEVRSYRVWLPAAEEGSAPPRPAAETKTRGETTPAVDDGRGPPRALEAVEAETGGNGLRLLVVSDGPITRHNQFFMGDPPRLVVDIPGRWRRPRFHARQLESALVERVRVGYHPGKLRLVLDLREGSSAPAATIRETPEGMAIEVRAR